MALQPAHSEQPHPHCFFQYLTGLTITGAVDLEGEEGPILSALETRMTRHGLLSEVNTPLRTPILFL
jgi:hypothetical protein